MAQNKNALIRYKTIDKCLQNQYREWTLNDLIEACSDALYEYEGRDVNVSKRTVQLDIQLMRSDKLGYNAPIVVYNKRYYKYEDPDYSITNIPLTENDMNVLSDSVAMLKQFKDFSLFSELGGIIQRLEDKVNTERSQSSAIIHLDKNESLKGLEHLDALYQAILKKLPLKLTYQSFKAAKPQVFNFHPFILKEFNNRWFLVGKRKKNIPVVTLALDRIIAIEYNLDIEYIEENFDGDQYYKDTFGVTVHEGAEPFRVEMKINPQNAPYVITKPFHSSQKVLEQYPNGSIRIEVCVHLNYEFMRLILGFGDSIEVIEPKILRRKIFQTHQKAMKIYKSQDV